MKNKRFTPSLIAVLVASLMGIAPAEAGFCSARCARPQPGRLRKMPRSSKWHKPVMAHGKPHDVVIQRSRHPQAAKHIDDAQRQGQPSVLYIATRGRSKAPCGSDRLGESASQASTTL